MAKLYFFKVIRNNNTTVIHICTRLSIIFGFRRRSSAIKIFILFLIYCDFASCTIITITLQVYLIEHLQIIYQYFGEHTITLIYINYYPIFKLCLHFCIHFLVCIFVTPFLFSLCLLQQQYSYH